MIFLKPYLIFITVSLLVSLLVYTKPKSAHYRYLRFFPPFLLITLSVEMVAVYLDSIREHNVRIYSYFSVFTFCFYFWFIRMVINNKRVKKIILIITVLYAVSAIVNLLFIQTKDVFNTNFYALGCLLITMACIYYFLELFRLPKSVNLAYNPAFWICSGLLFFYCCSFPLFSLIDVWAKTPLILKNFKNIVTILNAFIYSLFTIAFLCNKNPKYSS